MFTMNDFRAEFELCKKRLSDLGYVEVMDNNYTFELNSRIKRVLGRCNKRGEYTYNIELSKAYAYKGDIKCIKNTIMHEAIHSISGCMNHGNKWKSIANRVNSRYGYNIERCTSDVGEEYKKVLDDNTLSYKYIVTCSKCEREYKYKRDCQTLKDIRLNKGYSKCVCGCKDFKIKVV